MAAPASVRVCCEHGSVVVVIARRLSKFVSTNREVMVRSIGLDVHRDFCEVAISEAGQVRSAGRIAPRPDGREGVGQTLPADEQVV